MLVAVVVVGVVLGTVAVGANIVFVCDVVGVVLVALVVDG